MKVADWKLILRFEWDKGNLNKNRFKHNVVPKECEEMFVHKPLLVSEDIKHSLNEKRFQALGMTKRGRKLSIAFTLRDSKVRVVSARDQSKKERRQYEKIKTISSI